jgi:hypothetical protein
MTEWLLAARPITTIISILSSFLKSLAFFLPRLCNYFFRPNISIKIEHRMFQFNLADGTERIYELPYAILQNESKNEIKIRANGIFINNESYLTIIQTDNIYLRHFHPNIKQPLPVCDDQLVYKFYCDNWLNAVQGAAYLVIAPKASVLLPLKLIGSRLFLLSGNKKDSKIFFNDKKVSLTFNIKNKNYEYGLNRAVCISSYLSYLASHTARYDSKVCL